MTKSFDKRRAKSLKQKTKCGIIASERNDEPEQSGGLFSRKKPYQRFFKRRSETAVRKSYNTFLHVG